MTPLGWFVLGAFFGVAAVLVTGAELKRPRRMPQDARGEPGEGSGEPVSP